jgi:phosphohistidine phosphatase
MNLYVLRHGQAVEPGEGGISRDADRPLTPKGERRTWLAGEAMRSLELSLDLVLTSPYKRTLQTAEIVVKVLKLEKHLRVTETLGPGSSARRLIDLINRHSPAPGNVLVVGHEPGLSELISALIFGESTGGIVMKKGALCKLEVPVLRYTRCARLEWLLTAPQLCLMT